VRNGVGGGGGGGDLTPLFMGENKPYLMKLATSLQKKKQPPGWQI
jgi:hypothetical protein